MTVKECYESMGSDYEGVIGRIGSEGLVKRFALKFLDDPSYLNLEKAIQEQNAEEAFRAAHTLKGVCLNLGFDRLYKVSEELTEKLRGRELDRYEALYENVQKEYNNTIDAICKLEE
ncbi:Hpt domain-containing protein [Agathobacter sp.]|uniref:Hpt domain-containing protein n=1 Tax=Agathobacter sp. TaxID=2021311 RepID=UPI003FD88880